MKKSKRTALFFIFTAVFFSLFSLFPLKSSAITVNPVGAPADYGATSVYLYCFNTDTVLYEKEAEKELLPSSTAKMMTALVALEAYPDINEKIKLTSEILGNNSYSDYGFIKDAEVTVKDLLSALIIANSNSAANIFANAISGSSDSFAEKMTARAAELGMTSTVYKNPTGFDSDGAKTTARDVAILAKTLYRNKEYMALASSPSAPLTSSDRRVYTRNYLLGTWYTREYYYENANGMNAGSTDGAGNTLVATSNESDGYSYLAIILGGKNTPSADYLSEINSAYKVAVSLFKWAKESFSDLEVISPSMLLGEVKIKNGNKKTSVAVFPIESVVFHLPDYISREAFTYKTVFTVTELSAPVLKNTVVGTVSVSYNGEIIATAELVTGSSITADDSPTVGEIILSVLKNPITIIILFLLAFAMAMKIISIKKKKALAKANAAEENAEEKEDETEALPL